MFSEFTEKTEVKYKESSGAVSAIQKDITDLIILFGEDESMKSTEFFELFHTFARDFSTSYKNLLTQEKARQELEARKRA